MDDADELEWEVQLKHPSPDEESTENNNSKVVMRWMLNTGKKVVLTGVAISSVPFVVPPLVVISALGFAFSVPFGFVFASYACTHKLMTKLLPLPPPPPPPAGFEEEEDDVTAMEELEEQMDQDPKRGVEMRIDQLVDDPYVTVVDEGNVVPMEVLLLEENDESLLGEIRPAVVLDNDQYVVEEGAGAGESINESDIGMEKETTTTDSEEEIVEEEEEEEARNVQGINANNVVVVEPVAFPDETMDLNNKFDVETRDQVDHQDQRNVMVSNMERGASGEKSSEAVSKEQRNRNNETDHENAKTTSVATYGDITKDNLAGSLDELDTLILKRNKENVILSNADVRETADECGIYLFEETNAGFKTTIEVNGVVKEKKAVENVDFLEFHSSIQAPDQNVKSVPQVDTRPPSTELYSSEEKIWEQLDAMRAIVGYRATPQPTCIAELKALYIFTGVEPPASFKADSDLHEVNDKLRFLMSIVGVK